MPPIPVRDKQALATSDPPERPPDWQWSNGCPEVRCEMFAARNQNTHRAPLTCQPRNGSCTAANTCLPSLATSALKVGKDVLLDADVLDGRLNDHVHVAKVAVVERALQPRLTPSGARHTMQDLMQANQTQGCTAEGA